MEREAEQAALRRLREAQCAYDEAFAAHKRSLGTRDAEETDLKATSDALAKAAQSLRDAGDALRDARKGRPTEPV